MLSELKKTASSLLPKLMLAASIIVALSINTFFSPVGILFMTAAMSAKKYEN